MDPRSGRSTDHSLWSVTAFASSCGQAEVAAKVAFILGPDEGPRFLLRLGVAGLFVDRDGGQVAVGQWAGAIGAPPPAEAPASTAAIAPHSPSRRPRTAAVPS